MTSMFQIAVNGKGSAKYTHQNTCRNILKKLLTVKFYRRVFFTVHSHPHFIKADM